MDLNKQLYWWLATIMFCTLVLVGGVIAHDRGIDQAMIDHLLDFHLDVQERLEEDRDRYEADKIIEAEKQRRYNEFSDEVSGWWRDSGDSGSSSDRGTYTPPENNGNRE